MRPPSDRPAVDDHRRHRGPRSAAPRQLPHEALDGLSQWCDSPAVPVRLVYFRQPGGREPVRAFLDGIDNKKELAQVLADLTLLRDEGPVLPFPHSSSVVSFPGLRELRTRHGNAQFRVLYCVDKGDVVLLHAFVKRASSQARHEYELAAERAGRLK